MSGNGLRIRVDFTIEVDNASIPFLHELAGDEPHKINDLRQFVAAEAEDAVCQYLEMNGVDLTRVRSAYGRQGQR
jgi:hypothetical protein